MTRAAYSLSKVAERLLAPYVRALVGAEEHPEISPHTSAFDWDYRFGELLVDLKLACKARWYGQVSEETLDDIRRSLERGVHVALYVPPNLYLLTPNDLAFLAQGLSVDQLEDFPNLVVDEETGGRVWDLYSLMTS